MGGVIVRDEAGAQRDWAWVAAQGYRVREQDIVQPTGRGFYLTEIRETLGSATLMFRVLDENGIPSLNWTCHSWRGIGSTEAEDLSQNHFITCPVTRGAKVYSNGGLAGHGLGGEWDLGQGENGPTVAWIGSPSLPSAVVWGLGMLGGTNHFGMLDLTFQIKAGGIYVPPPDPGPTIDPIVDELRKLNAVVTALAKHLGVQSL